jgi:hypothetical protein
LLSGLGTPWTLLRIYAKCVVGQDEAAKRRISEALREG